MNRWSHVVFSWIAENNLCVKNVRFQQFRKHTAPLQRFVGSRKESAIRHFQYHRQRHRGVRAVRKWNTLNCLCICTFPRRVHGPACNPLCVRTLCKEAAAEITAAHQTPGELHGWAGILVWVSSWVIQYSSTGVHCVKTIHTFSSPSTHTLIATHSPLRYFTIFKVIVPFFTPSWPDR